MSYYDPVPTVGTSCMNNMAGSVVHVTLSFCIQGRCFMRERYGVEHIPDKSALNENVNVNDKVCML